jgi:hypothetical protein
VVVRGIIKEVRVEAIIEIIKNVVDQGGMRGGRK